MLELLVADSEEPQGDEIRLRVTDPCASDVEQVLRSPEDIWYGTHYVLRGDGVDIVAIATAGPLTRSGDPGEFLLYSCGQLTKERAVRDEVISAFLAALP